MSMSALGQLAARFDGLQRRERIVVSFSSVVALLVLAFVLLIEPLYIKTNQLNQELDLQTRTLANLTRQVSLLQEGLKNDPSEGVRAEINRLTARDAELAKLILDRSAYLVSPENMAEFLESVLKETPGIVLNQLTTLPAQPWGIGSDEEREGASEESSLQAELPVGPAVYRHAFEMELQGSYRSLYEYLSKLEALNQAFFWDALAFTVDEHPQGAIQLRIYTLSAESGWLGG